MNLLLDTHVLLWALTDDERLPPPARELIADSRTLAYVSAASIWEASIKASAGRLHLHGMNLVAHVREAGLLDLAITGEHAWAAGQLPDHHKDPFDRLLVAQARAQGLMLATADSALADYDVKLLDCSR
ncbi:MAG: type II toxin-antitoxin system VapC family toxin [Actinomycetota bacterium]